MLFGIEETKEKKAVLSCRKCTYTEEINPVNPVIYEHILKEDKTSRLALNPYLKNDPTLNHLTNIQCPNPACVSHGSKVENDVVAVKINDRNLIWMYQCVHCDASWKQASGIRA